MPAHLPAPDQTPYGRTLAERVADRLEAGGCVSGRHREFCGMGLWFMEGCYCYDESWDARPPELEAMLRPNTRGGRVFRARGEFVAWFAAQSDHSLAGFEKDAWFHQNQTITRERLRRELGCA